MQAKIAGRGYPPPGLERGADQDFLRVKQIHHNGEMRPTLFPTPVMMSLASKIALPRRCAQGICNQGCPCNESSWTG